MVHCCVLCIQNMAQFRVLFVLREYCGEYPKKYPSVTSYKAYREVLDCSIHFARD